MHLRFLPLLFTAALAAARLACAESLTLHLAPDGNDAWSGKLARPNAEHTGGPLATLVGARDAVRKARAAGAVESALVVVADGEYRLSEAVTFERQDGGITFAAETAAHPLFSGGRRITGFRAGDDGLWIADVPEVREGKWYFEQLVVNGSRAVRARTPNEGFFDGVRAADAPLPGVKLASPLGKTALIAKTEDIAPLAKLSPEELHDANVVVYHSWQTSRHRLAGLDATSGQLQFTGASRYTFFEFEPYHHLHFENFRSALDAPGEWFLDRKGTLFYKPRPGETLDTAEVIAPVSEQWLTIRGEAGKPVEGLHFKGLRFAHSKYLLPEEGWADAQADAALGAAIEVTDARDVSFEDCEFTQAGTYVAWFRHGTRDSRVTRCHLHDLASGGVKIGEMRAPSKPEEQVSHIAIENNIIQTGGRYFTGSIGVWIGHASDNDVIHNDIGDFFYSAVSVGWVWGFRPSVAARNRIEWNHFHHLGWGVLSDLGAIYTLGISPGTTMRHNVAHDISCSSYGGWGYYTDEGSTGILIENNVAYRTQSGGFHQHYGKENIVRNNIFAFAKEFQVRHSRSEDHLAFTFERNIVLWDEGKLLGHLDAGWKGAQVKLAQNLFWRRDGAVFDFAGNTFEAWKALGQDAGSLIEDPLFVDPDRGDFHLKPGSPAEKIGFVPFDYESAGVTGDAAWKRLAAARTYPPMTFGEKPKAPPMNLHEGFEFTAAGQKPRLAKLPKGENVGKIVVTNDRPKSGANCLQITDGPEVKPPFQPHFYYHPGHESGISRIAFDIRVEPTISFIHEWRNVNNTPYRTGPMLRIEKGWLLAQNKQLVQVPSNEWIHVEIEAALGENATGTWDLSVALPDQPPQKFEKLPFVHADAKALQWLGFISAGTQTGSYWLDNLDVENRAR